MLCVCGLAASRPSVALSPLSDSVALYALSPLPSRLLCGAKKDKDIVFYLLALISKGRTDSRSLFSP